MPFFARAFFANVELWNFGEQIPYSAASIEKTAYTGNEFQSSKVPPLCSQSNSAVSRAAAVVLFQPVVL